jgi:adenylate cyclase
MLFSDISGFTALTETLTRERGQRHGVDELARRINAVHQLLIDEVERASGSVVAFAGDGMSCWFDAAGDAPAQAAERAVACARAMQRAMQRYPELSIKVGVSAGAALRLVVGEPSIQCIDLLAGATVALAVTAEELAAAGEVVVDQAVADALQLMDLGAPRHSAAGAAFHLLPAAALPSELEANPPKHPATQSDDSPALGSDALRPWILPFVYERETSSGGLFATDLRPATALFLRASLGLGSSEEPDNDDADSSALNALVATVQRTLARHGGVLLEVQVDALGTCLYGNFGAAQVHEDDAQRALRAALELRTQFHANGTAAHFGLASGTLCVGGYGGASRRSFGAIGDAVNAAARLMALARPGEVLVAGRVRQPLADEDFSFEARAPIAVKGKAEPIPVFAITGLQRRRSIRLQEPATALPMVGREAEVALLSAAIDAACAGRGRVLRIVAEAGMGKSRLLAEAIRIARRSGLIGYGGACRQDGIRTPYFVWQGIWTAWFDLDPTLPPRRQRQAAQTALALHAPEHAEAWPLLGAVLGHEWPDTALTAPLLPKDRKALLHAVLLRCLQSAAAEATEDGTALLLVLEDLHAADPLSLELLAELTRGVDALPLLVLTAERRSAGEADALPALAHAQVIELQGLAASDVEHIVRAKLAQRFPERVSAVSAELLERIAARAQGNPFYVEELLDYLHDRGIDPRQSGAVQALELPSSLHSLVLSRIDALHTTQRNELKAASVIGREFAVAALQGYCPTLGSATGVAADLVELGRQGFTPPLPEATEPSHVFRHLVTHEVAYESIALDTRAQLHGQYASFVEAHAPGAADAPLLAHHFAQSERVLGRDKACHYLRLAGEQAAARFANDEALAHFERVLLWLPEDERLGRFELLEQRQAIFDLQARHDLQALDLDRMAQLAPQLPDAALCRAKVSVLRAKLQTELGHYAPATAHAHEALAWLDGESITTAATAARTLRVEATLQLAQLMLLSGDTAAARPLLDAALVMARDEGLLPAQVKAMSVIGRLQLQLGDAAQAERWFVEALAPARQGSLLRPLLNLLNNLGVAAQSQSRLDEAAQRYEEAMHIARRIGDRSGEATLLINLGGNSLLGGDLLQARLRNEQAARIFAETGETVKHALALVNCAEAHRELGQLAPALSLSEQALVLLRSGGSRPGEASVLENLGLIEAAAGRTETGLARLQAAVQLAREIGAAAREASALMHLGQLQTSLGELAAATVSLHQAQALVLPLGDEQLALQLDAAQALLGLARGAPNATERLEPLLQRLLAQQDASTAGAADTSNFPTTLYAAALQVLRAGQDPRLAALTQRSRRELQSRAERIPDEAARREFLAIPHHRLILDEPTYADGR